MAVEFLDPDGQPLRKWYARKIGKPYEVDENIYLNLHSSVIERGLPTGEYIYTDLLSSAASLLLDYYGKARGGNEEFQLFLQQVGTSAVHFPQREYANPIVQFVVTKSEMEMVNDLVVSLTGYHQEIIPVRKIKPFLSYVGTAFKVYQQQLQFFGGSVSPTINFLGLLDRLRLFFDNLNDCAVFNNYELSKFKSIMLVFNENKDIIAVTLLDSSGEQHSLPRGIAYYFSTLKAGSNKMVNEIVQNFNSILLGRQSKINWTQFIHNFLPDAGIVVNYYGAPQTDTEAHKLKINIQSRSPFGPLADLKSDLENIQRTIDNKTVQQKAFKEAQKEFRKSQLSLQQRLQKIVDDIQNITGEMDKVAGILNQYNITTLIEAALECLLFKGGFSGSVPDFIPGISPFDPKPPKISLKFPAIEFKLPIISINKALQVQIREQLKRTALAAVMSLIQSIADIIREICLTEPSENDQPAPSPLDLIDTNGPDSPLYQCYADFGFDPPSRSEPQVRDIMPVATSGDILEAFLTTLSPLITARELCDLFSGVADLQVFQVINNLIDKDFSSLRSHFPYGEQANLDSPGGADLANEALEQFFLCIGDLIDPNFCTGVYNDILPTIPNIDPCTIEDTQPFQDIMDLLGGIEDLYTDPDLNCGGGIIPSLGEIDSFNQAVTGLIDSITAPAQQTFVSDIGNFKSIIIEPQPLSPADEDELERQRELLQFLQGPPPPETPLPPGAENFFKNMIPDQAQEAFDGFKNIANTLASLGGQSQEELVANIRSLVASRPLLVAPKTRELYQNIEDIFLTTRLVTDPGSLDQYDNQAVKYYAFLINLLFRGDDPTASYGRVITYNINGGTEQDRIKLYATPTTSTAPASDLDATDLEKLNMRTNESRDFMTAIMQQASTVLGSDPTPMTKLFRRKLYPFTYFSIFNTAAYRLSTSPLFDPVKMNNFSLLPKLCSDGSTSNLDLLDINSIKRDALDEFVNNSCIEGNYELGPVRDAGLQAVVSLYYQVLIVDLMLKNIFMVSKFGVDYLASSPDAVNELLSQATHRVVTYLGGDDATGERYNMPGLVRLASAMVVKKIIARDPTGFRYPLTGVPTIAAQVSLLEHVANGGYWTADNPDLQDMGVRYLFEQRLQGTAEKVKEYFGILGNNSVEAYLANGMLHTELCDFDFLPPGFEGVFDYLDTTPKVAIKKEGGPSTVSWGNPTNLTEFMTLFDYIENGKEMFDLYWTNRGNFVGSTREQQINKEIDALAKYGTLAMERYFEVGYSKSSLTDFFDENSTTPVTQLASKLLIELREVFHIREPLPSPAVTQQQVISAAPSDTETYLMSFDAFKNIYESIAVLLTLDQPNKILPLPFYLAGYSNVYGRNNAGAGKRPIRAMIEVNDAEYSDQDSRTLSDYTLIRSWFKAIKENVKFYTNNDYSLSQEQIGQLQTFTCFSPDNGPLYFDRYPWLSAQDALGPKIAAEAVSAEDAPLTSDTALQGYYYPVASGPTDQDYDPEGTGFTYVGLDEYAPGNFLFSYELFDGVNFGPVEFSRSDWDAGDWGESNAKLIAESKNFKIVLTRQRGNDPQTGRMTLRVKTDEGFSSSTRIGGDYSSLDFYSGIPENMETDREWFNIADGLFDLYETEEELAAAMDLLVAPLDSYMVDPEAEQQEPEIEEGPYWNALVGQIAKGANLKTRDKAEFFAGEAEGQSSYMSQFIAAAFPSIQMGSRLAYITPPGDASDIDDLIDFLGSPGGDLIEGVAIARANKSYFVYPAGSATYFSHNATSMKALRNVLDDFTTVDDAFRRFIAANGTSQGFARYVEKVYEEKYPAMLTSLASQSETTKIFGDGALVDLPRILQYLYLIGELTTYYSLFANENMFEDTKQTLLLAIQAALAGSDTSATSACDVSALQNMMLNGASNALTPIASMGQSFINKMLKDTPKHILKGLCELTEPHVIVSKAVKDTSRQIFQGMDQAINMAQQGSNVANALSGISAGGQFANRDSACDEQLGVSTPGLSTPEIPPIPGIPSLDFLLDYIQGQIDQGFPEQFPEPLKPQVSKEGLALEGTLPYTLFLPPLTPFGIIYLLLRLSEFGHETVELVEDCENQYSELE